MEFHSKSEKRYNDVVYETITRKFENLFFTKHQNRLEISGSIHYFFNNDLHNADDFYIEDCIETIFYIKELFKLDLEKCFLVNLEYAVNINPIANVPDLILNIIYHEKRQFARHPKYFYSKQAGLEAYKQVKVYDKGV